MEHLTPSVLEDLAGALEELDGALESGFIVGSFLFDKLMNYAGLLYQYVIHF